MTQLLFQRCDGKPAGDPIALPRARSRRRLSTVVRRHADRTRPHIVSVHRKRHPLAVGDPLTVTDFSVRMRKQWSTTTVGPHDTVIIVYLPRGGGGGASGQSSGKQTGAAIGLIVATIALAALGQFWAIGAIGGALGTSTAVSGAIWAAASTALLAGAGYFLSKATQAKANKEEETRPLYGVSGGGNRPRSGDRIPVIYGRCWQTPDLSQPDYSIYDGDDQILYKRLTIGCGIYALKSVRVSNVVMWTSDGGLTPPFAGAQLEVILPGTLSTLVPGQVVTAPGVGSIELPKATDFPSTAGPFDFGAGAPLQSRIQIDFSLPQGCYAIPDGGKFQGKQFAANWGVRFDYAPCDEDGTPTGAWQVLHQEGANILTTQPQRFTRFAVLPVGRYTFRAQNIGDPDTSANPAGFNAIATNAIVWEGLRAHIPDVAVRPGVCELAMVIRSGNALGVTAFGEVEVEVQRVLPVYYGSPTGWVEEETSKAVWAYADILRNQLHGAGMSDGQIDLPRLQHYSTTLSQYDTFSGVIRGPVSVYEAASTVLGTMRASPLRLGSVWTLVRDEAKSVRKHVISRRQILKDSSGQTFNLDLSDGSADIIVEWDAEGDPRRRREFRKTFGTLTNSPRRMQAMGVTSAEHAIHIATWAGATAYFRRQRRSVGMELAGRLMLPNDLALIDHWYFDIFETAGVLDRDGLDLTIDSEIELPASPYCYLRARDGKEWGPVAVTLVGDQLSLNADDVALAESLTGLTLDEVLNTATQAFTTVIVGTLTDLSDAWLIRSIGFSGDTQVNIEAVLDAPEVWSALGESISPPPPPPSSGLETPSSIAIPYIKAKAVQRNGAMFMDWSCGRARNASIYVVLISYDDWATSEEAHRGQGSSGSYPLRETTGTVSVRAYAISTSGLYSLTVEIQFSVAPAFIDLENAIHGSLAIEAFTDNLEPVMLVDGLPDPVGWTKPTLVANIQEDGRLYRITPDGWKPMFDPSDLEGGVITETMIADDAISTPKLQANVVTSNELASNSVIAGKVQAGAISADKMNVTKLDAISADLGNISAGSLNINNLFQVASNGTVVIRNAVSGQRLEITNSVLNVFDSAGTLRVRLGIW